MHRILSAFSPQKKTPEAPNDKLSPVEAGEGQWERLPEAKRMSIFAHLGITVNETCYYR